MSACPSCGAATTPDLRFCLSCGNALAASCPTCGAARVPGARFCGQCGSRLPEAGGPAVRPDLPVAGPQRGSPESATGLRQADQAQMERRIVSVLFADLVGFTQRSEAQDPETVREFLGRYFEAAAEVIGRYGGTVEKFIGDAVMAVWGTPTAHEDDAERAVRAALELLDVVRGLGSREAPGRSATCAGSSPARVELRAAVMTGEAAVTVGAVGQGMVAGDLVNTSSRLQAVADPGSVFVDEATRVAAGRAIAFEPAGEHQLKGRSAPVSAWRALRVVAERGGVGRREGLEPPFVGRHEELRLLKDSLHATGREGKARLVTVVGQAGLGKSRLAWELLKYTDGLLETVWWHEGRSPAYGEGVAYWALGEMVRSRCRVGESESGPEARARLAAALAEFVPEPVERAWMEPRLAALLAIGEVPTGDREELFAAWRTFFERIAEQGTVVMLFEDLHWSDDGLLDFIEHLLEWARARPILVIALARPGLMDRRPTWGSGLRTSTTVHLEPLADADMSDLLRGLVPGIPAPTVAQVVARAEGVPLYAVETVRMLLDEGRLVREGERYRLRDPDAPVAVPPSLQALITARLDALVPEERALVQDAAVLGKTFTLEALEAVTGRPGERLEPLLRGLVRKEILALETRPLSPDRGLYGFVQGLLREVALSTLSRRDRRARHLAAARYVESLGDEELAGLVAGHYLDAHRAVPDGTDGEETASLARVALRAAAERSIALHASAAAVTFIEQALTVTSDPEERAALWVMATPPAWASSGVDTGERYIRQAIAWYEEHGRRVEADAAIAILADGLLADSRAVEARAILEPAVARLDDATAGPDGATLLNHLARAHLWDSRGLDALLVVDRGLAIAERLGLEPLIADLLITKGWAMELVGRHRESLLLTEGGLRLAERSGVMSTELRARMNLSNHLITSEPRRAFEVAGRGVELARRVGDLGWAAALAANQGIAALILGEWDVPIRNAEEFDRPYLNAFSRAGVAAPAVVALAFRGGDGGVYASGLDGIRSSASAMDRALAVSTDAMVGFARGRFRDGHRDAVAAVEAALFAAETQYAAWLSVHALTWLGDRHGLADLVVRLEPTVWAGGWGRARLHQARAAVAALEGRTDAARQAYRDALDGWRRMDLPPDIALTIVDMLVLFGRAIEDADALASEARTILTRLGAVGLLEYLDRLPIGHDMEARTA
jgi:class 3 adenylate cyclase